MKRKSHIITRIALAATVFTTTLAGVMPMTALAAGDITFTQSHEGTDTLVELTVEDGATGTGTATAITSYGNKSNDTWEITYGAASADVTATPATDYELTGWLLNGTTNINSPSGKLTKSQFNDTSGKLTATIQPVFTKIAYGVTVDPDTATFDKYSSSSNYKDIALTVSLSGSGNEVTSVTDSDGYTWVKDTNYTISGNTVTLKKETLAAKSTGSKVTITVNGKGTSKDTTDISIVDNTPVTLTPVPYTVNYDAGADVPVGKSITISTNTVPCFFNIHCVYTASDGSGKTVNISSPSNDATSASLPITTEMLGSTNFTVYFSATPKNNTTYDTNSFNRSYKIVAGTSSTAQDLDYLRWTESSKNAFSEITNYTDPSSYVASGSTPAVKLYQASKDMKHTSGLTIDDIKKELDGNKVEIKLKNISGTRTETVKWDYSFGSKKLSNYSSSKTSNQEFWVYSEPIAYSDNDSTTNKPAYRVGDFEYFRIKLYLKVGETDSSSSTGSSAPATPTFTPASGTYVYPGARIDFGPTATGVTFRSGFDSNVPDAKSNYDTNKFLQSSGILFSSGSSSNQLTAGQHKVNVIAFKDSSNSSSSSATYTLVTDNGRYALSQDANGNIVGTGDLGKLKSVWVDNIFVSQSGNYSTTSGSTIVTFTPAFVATKGAGTHSVTLVWEDGYATSNFSLTSGTGAANVNDVINNSGSSAGGNRGNMGTDDKADLVILFVLFGMVLAGFVVSVYYRNEKIRNYRD